VLRIDLRGDGKSGRASGSRPGKLTWIRRPPSGWAWVAILAPWASAMAATTTVTSVLSRPKLTVVGYGRPAAKDIAQQACVVPAELRALEKAGTPAQEPG